MTKLHIFNPEHDIALAINKPLFTAPHSVRQLREDLSFLPALYAEEGDYVLVDNIEAAQQAVRHLRAYAKDVHFITTDELAKLSLANEAVEVLPWGWDNSLCARLLQANEAFHSILPNERGLKNIRTLSSRAFASRHLLPRLTELDERLTGQSIWFTGTHDMVERYFALNNTRFVIKAPWSSSGRGVRYVDVSLDESNHGWIKNTLQQQGGLVIEPYYHCVLDFGMEFHAGHKGRITYKGLSVFTTENRAYTGNLLTGERTKREIITRYVPNELLKLVRNAIIEWLPDHFYPRYTGNFGIDMMIVATPTADKFLLHPCVALNLRNTMGHVALAISPSDAEPKKQMCIVYTNRYHLSIQTLGDDLLNTSLV